jgi:hypothetical protein
MVGSPAGEGVRGGVHRRDHGQGPPGSTDGQVRNRPVYAAIGVDLAGHKDILGMWAGDGDSRII